MCAWCASLCALSFCIQNLLKYDVLCTLYDVHTQYINLVNIPVYIYMVYSPVVYSIFLWCFLYDEREENIYVAAASALRVRASVKVPHIRAFHESQNAKIKHAGVRLSPQSLYSISYIYIKTSLYYTVAPQVILYRYSLVLYYVPCAPVRCT